MPNGPKRVLFLVSSSAEDEISQRLSKFKPHLIKSSDSALDQLVEGSALIVATQALPSGFISGLTRLTDVPFLYVLSQGESVDVARFWYHLGAEFVLSRQCPDEVLISAIEEMVTIETQSILSKLTRRESAILEHLKKAGEAGLRRAEIAEKVWGKSSVTEKNVDVHIFNLRRKLISSQYRIENQDGAFRLVEHSSN